MPGKRRFDRPRFSGVAVPIVAVEPMFLAQRLGPPVEWIGSKFEHDSGNLNIRQCGLISIAAMAGDGIVPGIILIGIVGCQNGIAVPAPCTRQPFAGMNHDTKHFAPRSDAAVIVQRRDAPRRTAMLAQQPADRAVGPFRRLAAIEYAVGIGVLPTKLRRVEPRIAPFST